MASASVAARRLFACSDVFVCQVPHFRLRQSRHALPVSSPDVLKEISASKNA